MLPDSRESIALAGDVGGTNARLALVHLEGNTLRIGRMERYPSHDYPGLGPIIQRFCRDVGANPGGACLAVAGPVVDGVCRATNLPWTVDATALARETGIPRTTIINDFDAVGYGLSELQPADLVAVQPGQPVEHGPIALIGPGTGLGEGFLVWNDGRYHVHSSEGGHADFAPRDATQSGLADFLRREHGHASYERVLSGRGIADAYRYLAGAEVGSESTAVHAELVAGRDDPAAIITRHALTRADALCQRAVALFFEVLAAQAGNLALTVAATGGVYIAGGITPRIVDLLSVDAFRATFANKGRMSDLLSRIPVHIVLNPDVGLLGAASVAAGRAHVG